MTQGRVSFSDYNTTMETSYASTSDDHQESPVDRNSKKRPRRAGRKHVRRQISLGGPDIRRTNSGQSFQLHPWWGSNVPPLQGFELSDFDVCRTLLDVNKFACLITLKNHFANVLESEIDTTEGTSTQLQTEESAVPSQEALHRDFSSQDLRAIAQLRSIQGEMQRETSVPAPPPPPFSATLTFIPYNPDQQCWICFKIALKRILFDCRAIWLTPLSLAAVVAIFLSQNGRLCRVLKNNSDIIVRAADKAGCCGSDEFNTV